jgi:CheY-like chemotaxis protein
VQEAGGSIAVQSSPGEGSCFEISFPISGSPAQSEFSAVAEELAPGGDETLLLVEDNNLIRSSLSKFLRNAGYQVLDAADAEEALRMSRDHLGFDLLVTDLALPGMSGLELATQLREQSPDVAVICISGDIPDPNQYPPEFWERQDIVFVPKSVDPTVLLRKIRQVFDTNLSGSYIGRER